MIVFIDSNIIYDNKLISRDFYEYLDIIKEITNCKFYIVDTVLYENTYTYFDKLNSKLERIEKDQALIKKDLNIDLNIQVDKVRKKAKKIYKKQIEKNLKDFDINIIKSNDYLEVKDYERILDLAVKKESPFIKKNQGFKDAVILFTAFKYVESKNSSTFYFVSKDNDFVNFDNINNVKMNLIKDVTELISDEDRNLTLEEVKTLKEKISKSISFESNINYENIENIIISELREYFPYYYDYSFNLEENISSKIKYLGKKNNDMFFDCILLIRGSGTVYEKDESGRPEPFGPFVFDFLPRYNVVIKKKPDESIEIVFNYIEIYDLEINDY